MTFIGILLFSIIQLLFFSGLILLWMRVKKDANIDPQWSRHLQIIQSKIAVFEDLSDRTETQVKQLTTMMENKICDLQNKIDEADEILNKISASMKKSMEVAQIFQDKIPHEEIIERQNTLKFVKAALMAHEGKGVEEILQSIDLPKSQIEFIVKVNSERLSFDPAQIPDWIKSEIHKDLSPKIKTKSSLRPLDQILKQTQMDLKPLAPHQEFIEDEGRDNENSQFAINTQDGNQKLDSPNPRKLNSEEVLNLQVNPKIVKQMGIRPVVFPRIEKPV